MEDLIGLAIVIAILYAVIKAIIWLLARVLAVAVSIIGIILVVLAVVGAIVGIFFTFKSFITASLERNHDREKHQKEPLYDVGLAPKNADGKFSFYEDYAPKSYYNGLMLKDAGVFLSSSWRELFARLGEFLEAISSANGFAKAVSIAKNVFSIISLLIFGTILSVILSVLVITFALIAQLVYKFFYIVFVAVDKLNFSIKNVSYRCDYCQEPYKLPVYLCPKCGVPHKNLRAGKFGIFHRRCVCGEILPCNTRMRSSSGMKRSELPAQCPICGKSDNAKFSRPLGIALIGGVGAGKTTFKTAFLCQFIEDSAIRSYIDVDFPTDDIEREYKQTKMFFSGSSAIPATRPGLEYDVTAFNFFMNHKSFDVPRYFHLYDMPGEVFETMNAKERLKHFSFSEGVIFVIDPYSLQSVVDNDEDLQGTAAVGMDINSLVDVFLKTLDTLPGMKKEGKRYTLPVAVAINKVDTKAIKELVGSLAIDKLQKEKPNVYKDKYDTMDYVCRCFLNSNGKSMAVTLLDQNFKNVRFFSCSSMGYAPKGRLIRFTPENVLSAVQWILTRSDKQLKSVWDGEKIEDLTETQKNRWHDCSDYAEYIENGYRVFN